MGNKFLKVENKEEWQKLLDKVLFKTFFHSLEWEEFLESQFKWLKFERYVWNNLALLSFARVKNKFISHPFCEYGGPLPLIASTDGKAFQRDLFDNFKDPFKINFHPRLLSYFKGIDFSENSRETYFFEDLQSQTESQLWQKVDRNRHRDIKKAQDEGFLIEKCQSEADLKILYDFYVRNLKRHKTVAYPFSFFKFFFKSSKAEIVLIKMGKKIIGGNIFLFYDKVIHSFLCGFGYKEKNAGVHSLVLWSEIKEGLNRGDHIFDFGATKKYSSLEDFKSRWGAKAYPIFELKNYKSESGLRKSKLRDVYAFLPTFLIKKLSSHLIKYKI